MNNHGKKEVGVTSTANANAVITNTIIWGNTATSPEVIGYWREQIGGSFDMAYSCVPHIFDPPEPGEDPIDPEDLPGVIDVDPVFVDQLYSGDLHLAAGSPCVDAGDNTTVPASLVADLDGNARFHDDPATPDTGNGIAPIVDMGAYEFGGGPPSPWTDLENDSTGPFGFLASNAILGNTP